MATRLLDQGTQTPSCPCRRHETLSVSLVTSYRWRHFSTQRQSALWNFTFNSSEIKHRTLAGKHVSFMHKPTNAHLWSFQPHMSFIIRTYMFSHSCDHLQCSLQQ
jgi:hypothetical protein